jgi:mono/diheme cytochrome c family protein
MGANVRTCAFMQVVALRALFGWAVLACLLGLSLSSACGHTEAARPAAQSASARSTPEHKAPIPTPSAARPAAASSRAPAAGTDDISAFMAEHFAVATWARDSVINGNLDALRRPVRALAEYRYTTVAPGGWLPQIAKLQEAARLTADARTLDLAATGVATMARICGDCHREHGGGPTFVGSHREAERPSSDSLGNRMYRHMWAADRMWEGLTGPSDESWHDGAAALAQAPEKPPRADPPLPPKFAAALQQVRELGQRAGEAETMEERANVYALFLATCAGCHAYQVELKF